MFVNQCAVYNVVQCMMAGVHCVQCVMVAYAQCAVYNYVHVLMMYV